MKALIYNLFYNIGYAVGCLRKQYEMGKRDGYNA